MAPKVGTVAQNFFFCNLFFFQKSNLEFRELAHIPATRSMHLPSFIAIQPAVWPLGPGQTKSRSDFNGLLGLGCAAAQLSAEVQ